MIKFKKGDKVRLVHPKHEAESQDWCAIAGLRIGETYTVNSVISDGWDWKYPIDGITVVEANTELGLVADRFELVNQNKAMIKVEINGRAAQPEKSKYPYIGVCESKGYKTVVLFSSNKTGVCLESNHQLNHVGIYSDWWEESLFTPLQGSITLSNE